MSNKFSKDKSGAGMALVPQDPRTTVKTTIAQSQTTNTTMSTTTKFNDNNTMELVVQRQTVVCEERAGIAEIHKRYTPTTEEVQELLRTMNFSKTETSSSNAKRKSGNFTAGGDKFSGISSKSTPKFKSNPTPLQLRSNRESLSPATMPTDFRANRTSASDKNSKVPSPTTPIVAKTWESKVTQSQHRTITSHTEQNIIKLNYPNGSKLSSPNSPLTRLRLDALPLKLPRNTSEVTPTITTTTNTTTAPPLRTGISSTYISPYRSITQTRAAVPLRPSLTSISPSTTTTTTTATIPSTPTPMTTKKANNLKPGRAYIFNNEIFEDKSEPRVGTQNDVAMLLQTFKYYGLKVDVYENPKLQKIKEVAKHIASKNFKDRSCIVIVILTHGDRNDVVKASDLPYSINDELLYPMLSNATLTDTPKFFFVQACKGNTEIGSLQTDSIKMSGPPKRILKCYSTFEGFVSYRTAAGSFFIQTLCEILRAQGDTKDIQDIIKDVNREVINRSKGKQVPSITTTDMEPYVFGDYKARK